MPIRLSRIDAATASVHGTAVALRGRALLVAGPSGAGKSGLAAQMLGMGAALVADDLCLIRREGAALHVMRPPGAPQGIELRGLGLVRADGPARATLAGIVLLEPSAERLPPPETVALLELRVPLLRHPYRFDAAAKLALWLADPDAGSR